MPTYIYKCEGCGTTLERRQSFTDAPLTSHEECGGSLHRVLSPAAVIFKGSGFYSTDYRSGSNGSSSSSSPSTNGSKSSSDATDSSSSTASTSPETAAKSTASD